VDILNSREWAILVWVLVLIGYITRPPRWQTLKEPLLGVLRALGSRHLVSAITLMAMYVVMMIYGLSHIGLWDPSLLKGTLIWFFSVAVFSLFQVNKFSESPHKLKALVADSFRLVVVIEYLVGAYTFHFAVELALVPLVVFLSALVAFSETKPEYESVHKFLSVVAALFGAAILGSVMYLLVHDFQLVANRQAVSDFVLPVILSALYTPFIAFMAVYSTYQTVLIRLRYSIKKRHVEIYARIVAMALFNVRIELLKRWSSNVAKCRLQSIGEVNHSFRQFFRMLAREKSPDTVSLPEGWSPSQAKNFVLSEGLETGYYNPIDPMKPTEWFSCSKMVEFGSGLFPNSIAYYLNGNECAVSSLKLKLNVNDPEHAEEAHAKLLSSADTLVREALGLDLRDMLSQAIIPGQEGTLDGPNFKITFAKSEWPNHVSGGYDLGVEISGI
jgi:hypothetical protein